MLEIDRLTKMISDMKRIAANPIFSPSPEDRHPPDAVRALKAVAAMDAEIIGKPEKRLAAWRSYLLSRTVVASVIVGAAHSGAGHHGAI